MNEAVIKVFDIESYPSHLVRLIDGKRHLFDEYIEQPHAANNLLPFDNWYSKKCDINADYRELQFEFLHQLSDYWIEGFHITRTFPDESFLQKYYWNRGLCLPDHTFTESYLLEILSTIDGHQDSKESFISSFMNIYNRNEFWLSPRKKMISIFATNSDFALCDSSQNMTTLYGCNFLGEIGRVIQEKINDPFYDFMTECTCPHMIQLRFRISDVVQETEAERYEYPQDFVINQLIGILVSQHFSPDIWNIHKNNSIFLAQLQNNVPPEQILSIEKLPQ